MFNEDDKEMYDQLIEQVQLGIKISLSGINSLMSDSEFKTAFKETTVQIASYSKVLYDSFTSEGFTKDESLALTAACISKSTGK